MFKILLTAKLGGVDVFFTFDLPLFGNILTFTVNGETKEILYPDEAYLS